MLSKLSQRQQSFESVKFGDRLVRIRKRLSEYAVDSSKSAVPEFWMLTVGLGSLRTPDEDKLTTRK
jgi:hypothetical protein